MKKSLMVILAAWVIALTAIANAQQPEHKLVHFQMAIMKRGPKWETTAAADRGRILQQHLAKLKSLLLDKILH